MDFESGFSTKESNSGRVVRSNDTNFKYLSYNKKSIFNRPKNWNSIKIKWSDFKYTLDKESGYSLTNGGLLRPLSPSSMIYSSSRGINYTLPVKSKASLVQTIDDIENGNYSVKKDEENNAKKLYRKITSFIRNFGRRTT